jgi:3',5'-cyclic AMP phosphodiesterase CpdA
MRPTLARGVAPAVLAVAVTVGCASASVPSASVPGAGTSSEQGAGSPAGAAAAPGSASAPHQAGAAVTGVSSGRASTDRVVIAAGDIAECSGDRDEATAALVAANPTATVLALGDLAYPDGSAQDFADCYGPSWGAFKARTRPVPGNHEYRTRDARAYFSYFGAAAGDPSQGYYSFELGLWHVVALNSNCKEVGGCEAGSPQEQWLRADLAAHPRECTLAYMHHPRFSSGKHGNTEDVDALWRALAEAKVDVVLSGHDHSYERFHLKNAAGSPYGYGMRLIVVGTGGASLRPFESLQPDSYVRASVADGVLKMNLRTGWYDWRFLPASGETFTEYSSAPCV